MNFLARNRFMDARFGPLTFSLIITWKPVSLSIPSLQWRRRRQGWRRRRRQRHIHRRCVVRNSPSRLSTPTTGTMIVGGGAAVLAWGWRAPAGCPGGCCSWRGGGMLEQYSLGLLGLTLGPGPGPPGNDADAHDDGTVRLEISAIGREIKQESWWSGLENKGLVYIIWMYFAKFY
jgi:hypothetical protein